MHRTPEVRGTYRAGIGRGGTKEGEIGQGPRFADAGAAFSPKHRSISVT